MIVLKILTKWLNNLVTPTKVGEERYTLIEQVNFNTLLLVASLLSVVSTFFNYYQLSNILLTVATTIFSLVFFYIYYLSRYKNRRNIWITTGIILLFLSVSWITNGGGAGSVSFIYILALIFMVFIIERKYTNIVFVVFILNILSLYSLEYIFGNKLIIPYPSFESHYNDMAFVLLLVLIFSFFTLRFFKFKYEDERRKVESQKKIIEQQNKEHVSSLMYASNLQRMIISNEEQLQFLFGDFFVLFKPKDLVSGDFYWVKQKEELGIVVVADCTGHGVPAALLSILGISLLEETFEQIKLKEKQFSAAEFLEILRIKFFRYMKKKDSSKILQDSIDLGIVIINYKESTLEFSGANRALIMVRDNKHSPPTEHKLDISSSTHNLFTYPGTKNTIGYNYQELSFVNHVINFFSDDTFYLFTDGYGDQFDLENRKKFKLGKLKEELLKTQSLPMTTQAEYLKNLFLLWRGETEQTDDVLIIGMRV